MLDYLEILKWGGYPVAIFAFFYGLNLGKKLNQQQRILDNIKAENEIAKKVNKIKQKTNKLSKDELIKLATDNGWLR